MAIERVRAYFEQLGIADRILELTQSIATVPLAAQALGCEPARIAKTLSFKLPDGSALLVVTAGDARIDNRKYKAQFGAKAKMLTPDEAQHMIGHAVGGVCPFAVNEAAAVYLDVTLRQFETIYPACGSSNSAVELSVPELERYACARGWVDVCQEREDS